MTETLTVTGLTPLELRELEDALGEDAVKEVGQIPPDANFPEPTTMIIATVLLSALALKTLAILINKPRKGGSREILIEKIDAHGKCTIWIKEAQSESGAVPERTIEAIGKALNVDTKALIAAAAPDKGG
jgi:hypothetical protein